MSVNGSCFSCYFSLPKAQFWTSDTIGGQKIHIDDAVYALINTCYIYAINSGQKGIEVAREWSRECGCSGEPDTATFQTYWIIQGKGSPRKLEASPRNMQKGYTKYSRVVECVWKPGEQRNGWGAQNLGSEIIDPNWVHDHFLFCVGLLDHPLALLASTYTPPLWNILYTPSACLWDLPPASWGFPCPG